MILMGLKRSIDNPDQEKMYGQIVELFQNDWFSHCFDQERNDPDKMHSLINVIPIGFSMLMDRREEKIPKLMMKLINLMLENDKKDSLRAARQNANQQA